MNSNNISLLQIPMPTYLQDIFRSREVVTLVHKKSNQEEEIPAKIRDYSVSTTPKDLIGNPLEVDLGEQVNFEVLELEKIPNNWTKEEATYGPLDLKETVKYLNIADKCVYKVCLCCAKDGVKTLAIITGLPSFFRGRVYYYGCYSLKQNEVSFSTMLKHHLRYCAKNATVDVAVNTMYSIIGSNKRHAEDVSYKYAGNSAFIEGLSYEKSYNVENNQYKLFLQINAINAESIFHPLWEQLTLINTYINLLNEEDNLGEVIISANPKPFHVVDGMITDLLTSYETRQYEQRPEINWGDLDVMNMRKEAFLDKLWKALSCLQYLEDVCNCLDELFTHLANEPINYDIPGLNKCTLGLIISGLKEGTMAVPTLSLAASLKFLIELGLNKLHNDYICLIQSMDPKGEIRFMEQWETISQSTNEVKKGTARKSRLSIAKAHENISGVLKQLNHISTLHIITQFMHLASNCKLVGTGTLSVVYDQIYKDKNLQRTFKTFQQLHMVDFECDLVSDQHSLTKTLPVVAINIAFFTKYQQDLTVKTIFHQSARPIFPRLVFNDYDVDDNHIEEKKYYVHKAHIFDSPLCN